ncbi:phosphoenolpyruvate carboxylase [Candidatus Roizmanbacteria bacterium RIFCSPHIGHO2_12_FULL_41_11]|uniref:Phosphoenolpyruvate carboxylase n=1 Tax=Candidatus Roizmanbacteria bacterium RIFCSPHIGHO2_12_FULL_41_11 TaxID=1802052 RepID=A0A1F7I1D3_9BACT|nr:MAG: phosphoenolpyruvate carboxylase [Candidatus Roizmanbacteria bacterium RIFCSPHIGHO2_12_FULL_41_11]
MRKIPATMVTQHPDHASTPYWHAEAFISVKEETEECYRSFAELGAGEYKWDWEGKLVDEAVVERLFSGYYDYFSRHPLGKEKFLTFRLPNPKVETEFRLGRAFMGIISASGLANQVNLPLPPLFEVILPMTQSAKEMIAVQAAFRELTSLQHPLLKLSEEGIRHIELIPLFEDVDTIVNSDKILETYLNLHEAMFAFKPRYLRPYVARSDPALNAGIVPTVLAIKIALSHYRQFAERHQIALYPIIGCAALPFRGGLTPSNVPQFAQEYAGIRTTTIQSAFRYDYDKTQVIKGIRQLEELLPKGKPPAVLAKEEKMLRVAMREFAQYYKNTIEQIAPIVNEVASHLPRRRERVLHVGLFGYSRGVGKVKLPRAIGFTAALYSLGVPPELIGTGRGLQKVKSLKSKVKSEKSPIELLEKYYLNLKSDLQRAGRYVNKNVLAKLAKKSAAWQEVEQDIKEIEKYLGEELKPKTAEEKEHHNMVGRIYNCLQADLSAKKFITQAAVLRRSLG